MTAPLIFTPEYYRRMRSLERLAWWNAGMRDVADMLLDLARLGPTGVLLDIGCGSGQTLAWFAERHPSWRTIGLDVAAEGVAAASAMGTPGVMRASALGLPLPAASVDLAMSLDVLQHLPLDGGDRRALAEIARVVRPGGHCFLRTNAQTIPRTADDPEFNFHKYRPEELRAKLDAAGFDVIRLGRVNALLGLAEIPGDLRARRDRHAYHGLQATARREPAWLWSAKRGILRIEGRAVIHGLSWPLGRTIVALARRREGARP
jgi:SAM-dependent methyltransferase